MTTNMLNAKAYNNDCPSEMTNAGYNLGLQFFNIIAILFTPTQFSGNGAFFLVAHNGSTFVSAGDASMTRKKPVVPPTLMKGVILNKRPPSHQPVQESESWCETSTSSRVGLILAQLCKRQTDEAL